MEIVLKLNSLEKKCKKEYKLVADPRFPIRGHNTVGEGTSVIAKVYPLPGQSS